ncbi:hypothetical protein QF019_002415 [Pseudomonas frederiksbergensis]|uniref:hypothetical protein n=1 Tax=Pseudomonas frederiksbergensis TaxID=104087 RepID=UPI003D1EC5A4
MDVDFVVKAAGVIFALSGWFKVAYDHQANKPKIVGKLLNFLCGEFISPSNKKYTVFMMYPYLLNARKNSVHILDYEAYIKTPKLKKWQKISRFYGLERVQELIFNSAGGGLIRINDLPAGYIYKKEGPVQQGIPLHGWVPFLADGDLDAMNATHFKLVCIDANSKKHTVIQKTDDLIPLPLLMQIANIELPPDMMPGPGC